MKMLLFLEMTNHSFKKCFSVPPPQCLYFHSSNDLYLRFHIEIISDVLSFFCLMNRVDIHLHLFDLCWFYHCFLSLMPLNWFFNCFRFDQKSPYSCWFIEFIFDASSFLIDLHIFLHLFHSDESLNFER